MRRGRNNDCVHVAIGGGHQAPAGFTLGAWYVLPLPVPPCYVSGGGDTKGGRAGTLWTRRALQ